MSDFALQRLNNIITEMILGRIAFYLTEFITNTMTKQTKLLILVTHLTSKLSVFLSENLFEIEKAY